MMFKHHCKKSLRSAAFAGLVLCSVLGCGSGGIAPTEVVPPQVSDNWLIVVTPPSSDPRYVSQLAGAIVVGGSQQPSTSVESSLTAASACYQPTASVPLSGSLMNGRLTLHSFNVQDQFLDISSTFDNTRGTLSGVLSVGGGCANGQSSPISGIRYAALIGTFKSDNASEGLSLTLNQHVSPTGQGAFLLDGKISVEGGSCASTASILLAQSSVRGNQFTASAQTERGFLMLSGSLDVQAARLTVTSLTMSGADCGAFGVLLKGS